MNKTPEEHFIIKLIEETGQTREQIEQLVQDKENDLKGLISREGAYLIVMRELGIKDSIIPEDNMMSEITKEKIEISEEQQKTIDEEVNEIKEDNKELMEILKSKPFKRGKRLIDYFFVQLKKFFEENINLVNNGLDMSAGVKSTLKTPTKKDKIEFIEHVICTDYSEKAWKLRNKDDLICYIPKSCTEKIENNKLYLTSKAKNFITPEWQEDK